MLKLLGPFTEELTDDDAVPVQKKRSRQNETGEESFLAKDKPPSAETDAEGGPTIPNPRKINTFSCPEGSGLWCMLDDQKPHAQDAETYL